MRFVARKQNWIFSQSYARLVLLYAADEQQQFHRCSSGKSNRVLILIESYTLLCLQIREGLDLNEVADFMRGLGFFPSDYEIECMQHELTIRGRRKIPFEGLVKLFINHSRPSDSRATLDRAIRQALNVDEKNSTSIIVRKSNLLPILTESAERIDAKDADLHFKEIFRDEQGKLVDELSLDDFLVTLNSHSRSHYY